MAIEQRCPLCNAEVSFWRTFIKSLGSVTCPRCKARLRFERNNSIRGLDLGIYGALYLLFYAVLGKAGAQSELSSTSIHWIAAIMAARFLSKLLMTVIARRTRALVSAEKSGKEAAAPS